MLWLQHLFALYLLAHMLWAAVALQREWRRIRRHGASRHPGPRGELAGALAGAEASRVSTS